MQYKLSGSVQLPLLILFMSNQGIAEVVLIKGILVTAEALVKAVNARDEQVSASDAADWFTYCGLYPQC